MDRKKVNLIVYCVIVPTIIGILNMKRKKEEEKLNEECNRMTNEFIENIFRNKEES